MKKHVLALAVIGMLAAAYYLISPIWRTSMLDEASPLEQQPVQKEQTMEEAMEAVKDEYTEMDDNMPESPTVLAEASFTAHAHEVLGKALLIQHANETTLRFENFETINGPNLHIYLSADLSANDFVDLGPIRATQGNVNYEVPEGTDLTKYKNVLVWCVPFGVLFSAASL